MPDREQQVGDRERPAFGRRIRVLLVDDRVGGHRSLRTLLDLQGDIEVVGEAADCEEGVAWVGELRPDVILMDIRSPSTEAVEALVLLRAAQSPVRVLILTGSGDRRTAVSALRAGADGYLSKDIAPLALVDAVRSVHAGQVTLQPDVAAALLYGE